MDDDNEKPAAPTRNILLRTHVLQATTAKFGKHVANMIVNIQNEEAIYTRFILPAYFSTEYVW